MSRELGVPAPRRDPEQAWESALAAVRADEQQPRIVFQPIVDLRRGVVAGYEALARFPAILAPAPPDVWFAAAGARGWGAALEARVVRQVLSRRDTLPPNCFLSLNVSPHLLAEPEMREAFASVADLSRIVVELTEHVRVEDVDGVQAELRSLRERGALIALDDAGTGYSGLAQIATFRPQVVKLDRSLVDHVDDDEVKIALAELLGTWVGRLDAWLLAEGVERAEEVRALCRLGVPLAQGWFFGAGTSAWSDLDAGVGAWLRGLSSAAKDDTSVRSLIEPVPALTDLRRHGGGLAVLVDRHARPVLLLGPQPQCTRGASLRVAAHAQVAEVARRAMARPPEVRFDPVVCTDETGGLLGLVRVERLVQLLARAGDAEGAADKDEMSMRRA
ncbi:MAG: EAL domain-containing protein [Actinobacteria bacterium]|nr:EAL domain-containing protein [Actinomycetota bacterium]MCA1720912.1 EAL domain-containing protein [Actinomycetota bacterium]